MLTEASPQRTGRPDPDTILDHGFEAALRLAATRPWASLGLREIASEAGLSLTDFHGVADRDRLALHVDTYFDRAMSGEAVDPGEPARERLFEVIMLRFEAMEPHREGLLSLLRSLDRAPLLRVQRLAARRGSAEWALISAGLDGASQVPMAAKAIGLAWVIARAEDAWRRETDPGFARTMAALDKGLRQAEERMQRMTRFTRPRRRGETEANPAAPGTHDPADPGPGHAPASDA